MKSERIFNLLKPIEPPKTVWDKVYDWILGRARIVILITIILVALAFGAKVIVDTEAKNKTKDIDRLQAELSFYGGEVEPRYREIHKKEDNYIKLWNGSTDLATVITEVNSYLGSAAKELTIRIDGKSLSIFGYEALEDVSALESALKTSETFTKVFVDTLSLEGQEVLDLTGQYVLVAEIKDYTREQI